MTCADIIEFLKKQPSVVIANDDAGTRVGVLKDGSRNDYYRNWFSAGNLNDAVSLAKSKLDSAA